MKKTAKVSSDKKGGAVIRLVALKNPKTKREVYARVTADGKLGKRDAQHLGVKNVSSWIEVVARSWASATQAAKAGRGKRVGQGKAHRAQSTRAA